MNVFTRVGAVLGAACLSIALLGVGSMAAAQSTSDADSVEAPIVNAQGQEVGTMYIGEAPTMVTFTILLNAGSLEPGEHGIHIHEVGSCDPAGDTTFELAGAHFNASNASHGSPNSDESHAGDLGNLTVADDGSAQFSISTDAVTLQVDEPASLLDADGSALIIHAGADDLTTDPSGESGGRLLCSVISPATDATPTA